MQRGRFTPEYKRSIIAQLLSEAASLAEFCRRHDLSLRRLYAWKDHYAQCHFASDPSKTARFAARVAELERMLGKVALIFTEAGVLGIC